AFLFAGSPQQDGSVRLGALEIRRFGGAEGYYISLPPVNSACLRASWVSPTSGLPIQQAGISACACESISSSRAARLPSRPETTIPRPLPLAGRRSSSIFTPEIRYEHPAYLSYRRARPARLRDGAPLIYPSSSTRYAMTKDEIDALNMQVWD